MWVKKKENGRIKNNEWTHAHPTLRPGVEPSYLIC